jgi:hypothetical protein
LLEEGLAMTTETGVWNSATWALIAPLPRPA